MSEDYRWIVGVRGTRSTRAPYVREVTTDGPVPDEAVKKALDKITQADNDLWQLDKLTIDVERVR